MTNLNCKLHFAIIKLLNSYRIIHFAGIHFCQFTLVTKLANLNTSQNVLQKNKSWIIQIQSSSSSSNLITSNERCSSINTNSMNSFFWTSYHKPLNLTGTLPCFYEELINLMVKFQHQIFLQGLMIWIRITICKYKYEMRYIQETEIILFFLHFYNLLLLKWRVVLHTKILFHPSRQVLMLLKLKRHNALIPDSKSPWVKTKYPSEYKDMIIITMYTI